MNNIGIDDEILEVWAREKNGMSEKIKTANFSWCAFLFEGYYFIYRKMYLIGIIEIIISTIASILVSLLSEIFGLTGFWIIGQLVISVINGLVFYPLYRIHIRNTLNKNRNKNINPVQIAQLKGGVNSGAVGLAIGIVFTILIVSSFIFIIFVTLYIYMSNPLTDRYYDEYYDDKYYDDLYEYYQDYRTIDLIKDINDYYFDINYCS